MKPQTVTAYVQLDADNLASNTSDRFLARYLMALPGYLADDPLTLWKLGQRIGRIIARTIGDSGNLAAVSALLSGISAGLNQTEAG